MKVVAIFAMPHQPSSLKNAFGLWSHRKAMLATLRPDRFARNLAVQEVTFSEYSCQGTFCVNDDSNVTTVLVHFVQYVTYGCGSVDGPVV
jgi:hypothetical protein